MHAENGIERDMVNTGARQRVGTIARARVRFRNTRVSNQVESHREALYFFLVRSTRKSRRNVRPKLLHFRGGVAARATRNEINKPHVRRSAFAGRAGEGGERGVSARARASKFRRANRNVPIAALNVAASQRRKEQ